MIEAFQSTHPIATLAIEQNVMLLDGRKIVVRAGQDLHLYDADGAKRKIYYEHLDITIPYHASLFRVFYGTLGTHSLVYNTAVSQAFKLWMLEPALADCQELGITQLEALLSLSANYHPFIFPALRRISAQNLPGLTDELKDFLKHGQKWEEKGNGAYYTLVTNDPSRGALTDQELHNLHAALNLGYANGTVKQADFTMCWFFIGTGVRPIQLARMKKRDIQIVEGPEGDEVTLRIPLAKGEQKDKQEYWLRRAPSVLAECLVEYLNSPAITSIGVDDAVFPGGSRALSMRLSHCFAGLETYSERLEERIPVTPYRFRYTLATRALAHGASDYEVARLLTHRSTSCIQFYRASMPQLQNPIRQAIGKELEYFAKAFQGRLIQDLSEATRSGDESAVISDFLRLVGQKVGACGTKAECHQNAPIACLYCPFFEPLADAPWEMLLASLKADQDTELEDRIRLINHNAMSAISEIMERRDTMKAQRMADQING
ncbi:site-specific integrase [Pseudomonas sp. TH04]|uniref:site-specific integrase n=1 Tax=Pseudomonas sp. TH04 TaxID=2796370 RepID=UPI0019129F14|nr:site-specific integrase [Pseudomonas sp. TH04]MBK5547643.1 site-specific integrase [Pseudomonas sp. TH04]